MLSIILLNQVNRVFNVVPAGISVLVVLVVVDEAESSVGYEVGAAPVGVATTVRIVVGVTSATLALTAGESEYVATGGTAAEDEVTSLGDGDEDPDPPIVKSIQASYVWSIVRASHHH